MGHTFDPWPIVTAMSPAEQDALDLTDLQRLQIKFAYQLLDMRSRIKTGYDVLSAAARCAGSGVPLPDWLAREFFRRFRTVADFAVGSLDDVEAFGPLPELPEGTKQRRSAHLRARYGEMVELLFSPGLGTARLPRTEAGRKEAAEMLGISEKQVRELLPPVRVRRRRKKVAPQRPSANAVAAANPFNLKKARS